MSRDAESELAHIEDLAYWSVGRLSRALAAGEISASEAVDACLRRISSVNGDLNAVVQLAPTARVEAEQADLDLERGKSRGILHGVPMTIKDSFDTAGVVSTGGTTGRRDFVPACDATVVSRLRAAGAVLVGKTNTPELTFSFNTSNRIYGQTHNPYGLEYSPGGSSGGAAAIVAAGGAPFDIGSDYGGSIRAPAAFCGVAGLKPTSGRVPRTGHIVPFGIGAPDSFQQVGPIARSIADVEMIAKVIAGPDFIDPAIADVPFGDSGEIDLSALRVAFYTDDGVATPEPDVRATVERVAEFLDGICQVSESRPAHLGETWRHWKALDGADGGAAVARLLAGYGTERQDTDVAEKGPAVGGEEFGRVIEDADDFRSRMIRFMADFDVILCPVNATVANRISDGRVLENFSYTAVFNVTGWPAATVRAGVTDIGLPVGVQVVARPWREDHALAVAAAIETEFGGWVPPPI